MKKQRLALMIFALSTAGLVKAADFNAVDENDDGLIDRSEFGGSTVGERVFQEWDTNEDGHIDRAEWRRATRLNELEAERERD